MKDTEVLALAVAEQRILITNDKDFGELVFRRGLDHAGIVLFRLENEPIPVKEYWLGQVLAVHADRLGDFVVVTDHGVRVRRDGSGTEP